MEDIMQLCDVVRETGFAIHRYHKHGLLINFCAPKFQIKKYALSQPGQGAGTDGFASVLLSASALLAPFGG